MPDDLRARDHTDDRKDIARDLADVAAQLASLKGEAYIYMRDPNLYTALRLRLEIAHAVPWRLPR